MISHKLAEIAEIADRTTIIRDGQSIETIEMHGPDAPEGDLQDRIIRGMVGRDLEHRYPERESHPGEEVLRIEDWSVYHPTQVGRVVVDGANLTVRAGEVVGIAGLQGAGRTELARAVFGADPFTSGTVEVDGSEVRMRRARHGIRAGVALVTEDRKAEGLALGQSVRDNTLLALRGGAGPERARSGLVERLAAATELRAASLEQEVRYLSGGNQQKVVLAKWLALEPGVLVFDEPTRGVDVGAKAAIHQMIRDLARDGTAVVMISSELPELIGMSDRIVVMHEGRIAGELPAGATEHQVIALAAGQSPEDVVAAGDEAGDVGVAP
jgi:ABC-type sugar transport system ATPase subunit